MQKYRFTIIGLALAVAIVLPWVVAYRSDKAVQYHYGLVEGRQLECVAIDGTHFDRYYCLVFDSSMEVRVNYGHGQILLDGRPLQFPLGQNICFLKPNGHTDFLKIADRDITPDFEGRSEIYYIFGKVPHLKHFTFGVPRTEFIAQKFQNLN